MLALSVKEFGRVRITLPDGRHGWVTVVEIIRGKCRLGWDLPTDVVLLREELLPQQERYVHTTKHTKHGRPQGRDDRQEKTETADPEFGFSIDGIDPPEPRV